MPQGSPEWIKARLGVVTASEMDAILTPSFVARTGEGVRTYLYKKITEKMLGFSQDDASSFAMNQGVILEGECLPWLAFVHNYNLTKVGFCTNDAGTVGCSPDSLIDEDGGVEAKCPQPTTALKYLLEGGVPSQYLVQVHANMFVTGRKWWLFVSYSRQWPAHIVRVERDEKIMTAMGEALAAFQKKFDEGYAFISKLKGSENAAKEAAYYKSEGVTA